LRGRLRAWERLERCEGLRFYLRLQRAEEG
jgi:hypothetical protein